MRHNILQVTKAVLAAVIFSLACVLIFSVIISFASLSSAVIKPVVQVFKIIAVALGGVLFIRGDKGLLKGAIYGVIAIICTYLLFGIIASSLSISWLFLAELLLGAAAGAVSGLIGINLRRR